MQDDWYAKAERVEEKLALAPAGGREAALKSLVAGERLGVTALRQYLAAHAFLARLAKVDSTLAERLRLAPVAAVEALRRWHARDPREALERARAAADGLYTVRRLVDAERRSRPVDRPWHRERDQWRETLLAGPPLLVDLAPEEVSFRTATRLGWTPEDQPVARLGGRLRKPSPDRRLLHVDLVAGDGATELPVALVGPFARRDVYAERASERLMRAAGLLAFGDHAVLLLPAAAPTAPYADWLFRADGLAAGFLSLSSRLLVLRETPGGFARIEKSAATTNIKEAGF